MKDLSGCELGVEPVDLALQPGHLRVGDGQPRAARPLFGEAQIGLDVEQVVLDAAKRAHRARIARGMQPHQADHRIDLIDGAIGRDPQIVFLAPRPGAERRGAVVAGAGINTVEHDHGDLCLRLRIRSRLSSYPGFRLKKWG